MQFVAVCVMTIWADPCEAFVSRLLYVLLRTVTQTALTRRCRRLIGQDVTSADHCGIARVSYTRKNLGGPARPVMIDSARLGSLSRYEA